MEQLVELGTVALIGIGVLWFGLLPLVWTWLVAGGPDGSVPPEVRAAIRARQTAHGISVLLLAGWVVVEGLDGISHRTPEFQRRLFVAAIPGAFLIGCAANIAMEFRLKRWAEARHSSQDAVADADPPILNLNPGRWKGLHVLLCIASIVAALIFVRVAYSSIIIVQTPILLGLGIIGLSAITNDPVGTFATEGRDGIAKILATYGVLLGVLVTVLCCALPT